MDGSSGRSLQDEIRLGGDVTGESTIHMSVLTLKPPGTISEDFGDGMQASSLFRVPIYRHGTGILPVAVSVVTGGMMSVLIRITPPRRGRLT